MKSNKIIRLLTILLSIILSISIYTSTVYAVLFTDIDENHPYLPAIRYLKQNGVINGYPDGSFRPKREVNRAEALKFLTLSEEILGQGVASQDAEIRFMEDLDSEAAEDFDLTDVPDDSWYYKYVMQAFKEDIINGYSDRTFRPSNTVNLAEAIKMLLETNRVETGAAEEITKDPFKDAYKDEWYAPYLQYAKDKYVLIADMDLKVRPEKNITRQEMANLIYRFYNLEESQIYGRASYYADYFDGKNTASGEVFKQDEFTGAHLTLPFGSLVKVVNLETEKSVVIRITDRGPYDKRFVLDLSKAAFETISPISRGVIQVYYEIIYTP
ncbi:MAG: septal ring lytic transglycosylase RlpA family protein [Candidatus Peregrinibacteria bacterium]|nr:septal ring lytic transglycosylase RlpA family protein [Candidatus Peregrinibacteria bacterium]MDZ4244783.1 septal ring lytic transglycosylase RlpA family protein [Candidatus Gracilibacteria bacterium]